MLVGEEGPLPVGFDALGDEGDPQPVGEADDRPGDGGVGAAEWGVADEGTVELDDVDLEPAEIGQRPGLTPAQ
jgi:hypothetical protein